MRKSFSLIEVIIFVSILSMFLISAASVVTVTLQQNTLQINKLKARHYTDQLHEWVKVEKEVDWLTFVTRAGNMIYCFETDEPVWGTTAATGSDCPLLQSFYKRYIIFKTIGTGANAQVEAIVQTDWSEVGNSYSTSIHTIFSQWQ